MNDFEAPPIPYLSDSRLLTLERHLVREITASRQRRQRRGLVLGGAGLAAAAIITAVAVVVGTGAPPAFAAWTAAPTKPAPGQLAAAEKACSARPVNPPPGVPTLPTQLTLADTRGPFTLLLFGANTASSGVLMCMNGPGGTQLSIAGGSQLALPTAGQVTLDRLQGESANGKPYTVAEGSSGSGVSAVTLTLTDGSRVVTTVGHGLFLAWWPGSATVTSAAVTTASGTTTQPITSPTRDTGSSGTASFSVTAPGNGNAPHTASQRAELRRFCTQLKAEGVHGPDGQPVGPCAALGRP